MTRMIRRPVSPTDRATRPRRHDGERRTGDASTEVDEAPPLASRTSGYGGDGSVAPRADALSSRYALASVVQPRLTVGPVDDPYEREADQVAGEVVRHLADRTSGSAAAGTTSTAARTGRAPAPAAARTVRRRAPIGAEGGELDRETAATLRRATGGGRPLPDGTRSQMESAFGSDLSAVRVHTGAESAALNDRIDATAFTLGSHIFFREGLPDTSSRPGQELLAHEITHTIQQSGQQSGQQSRGRGPASAGVGAVERTLRRRPGPTLRSGPRVQRWNPFKRRKKPAASTTDFDNVSISGPTGGRVVGQPSPATTRHKVLPKFEYERDLRRRRAFADWAQRTGTDPTLTADILEMDYVMSPFQSTTPPSLDEALEIVRRLRACGDPFVTTKIEESEARWAEHGEVFTLEDNLRDEQQYRKKFGGLQQLAGLSGIIHYKVLGTYNAFGDTDAYQQAMSVKLPEVPSRPRPAPPAAPTTDQPPVPAPVADAPGGTSGGKVSQLADQLGGVIGNVRPGGAPSRAKPTPPPRPPRHDLPGGRSKTAEKVEKVELREREELRGTERKVLAAIAGGAVPDELLTKLGKKMAKGQTRARGREVTEMTEAEYAEIVGHLAPDEVAVLKQAIKNYGLDSSVVNAAARGISSGEDKARGDRLVAEIDEMFDVLDAKGLTDRTRITYRLSLYKKDQEVPYGSKINVGDHVTDQGFMSSSENRRLLEVGSKLFEKGARYVKYTIIGAGGANISGASEYTNANEKAMAEFEAKRSGLGSRLRLRAKGPDAGQAEVLYRRNSVFVVEKIIDEGRDVHVVIRKVDPAAAKGSAKNAFDGSSIAIP